MKITKKYIDMGYTLIPISKVITVEWENGYTESEVMFVGSLSECFEYEVEGKGKIYTTYGKEYILNNKKDFKTIKELLMKN